MMDLKHLWWLKTTQDVVLGCSGLPANQKSENKTPGVFFQAAFDFDAPGAQKTHQK